MTCGVSWIWKQLFSAVRGIPKGIINGSNHLGHVMGCHCIRCDWVHSKSEGLLLGYCYARGSLNSHSHWDRCPPFAHWTIQNQQNMQCLSQHFQLHFYWETFLFKPLLSMKPTSIRENKLALAPQNAETAQLYTILPSMMSHIIMHTISRCSSLGAQQHWH